MIKNLKYRLTELFSDRRVRIGGMSILLALTVLAVTLLGCPIHTVEILTGQRFHTLSKTYSPKVISVIKVEETEAAFTEETETTEFPVYIVCGDQTTFLTFREGTVADALAFAGYTPDSDDFVEPALDTVITDTIYIDYTVVDTKKVRTSADVNDISTLSVPFTIELDDNGNPVNYKEKRVARATAYTYTGNNCSTGVAPQPGYIAVNPKVIPYGTKMYIKSADGSIIYGYAVAADTGGFIRNYPTGVDLFFTTEGACVNFGVRNMEIYILE